MIFRRLYAAFVSALMLATSAVAQTAASLPAQPAKVPSTTSIMRNATVLITNPSFESGTERGWTLNGKDPQGNDEFRTRNYPMTGKDGNYLMNAYQWWAPSLSVSQEIGYIPSGEYELSAVVATWNGRTVYLQGNDNTVVTDGRGDVTGIKVSLPLTIGLAQTLTIAAGSSAQWWMEGHETETQTFFKLDDVRLKCKCFYVNGLAQPLPNDDATRLKADQWYYFDVAFGTDYWLVGPTDDILYTTDALVKPEEADIKPAARQMQLPTGRVFFKTARTDATLKVMPTREILQGTFTAAALNVDGLPQRIATIELNADGPGSEGTKKISQYLAAKGYDIIGVSEDFNYHGSLMGDLEGYSSGSQRATLSVSDLPWSEIIKLKFRFDTDGLNLIWRNDVASATGESWTQWNSMEATDGNQYVRKGFRHYDLTIADDVVVDLYVLHMDAGDMQVVASREDQWRQLADAINAADPERPKLILGDTNSRWTRENIADNFFGRLHAELRAEDVWVELCRGGVRPAVGSGDLTDQSMPEAYGKYEVVDKVIYINSSRTGAVQLTPQSFRIEQDYTYGTVDGTDNTKPLGDHRPVVVAFSYTKAGELLPEPLYDAVDTVPATRKGKRAVYNLAGQSLGNRPGAQGIYVIDNRKVALPRR